MAGATALRPTPVSGAGPLALTAFRLAMAVVILPVGWRQPRLPDWALVVYGVAAVTDSLDGYLARRSGSCTALGATLDLWADKVWVVVALALLVHGGVLGPLAPAMIVLREATVTIRRWQLGRHGLDLPPTPRSKGKTVLQMSSLWLLLALPEVPGHAAIIWAVVLYTWATGLELLWRRPIERGTPRVQAG